MIAPGRTVALVGRPNVGKSRLFNRLVGRRVSIVHDQPGVTRDLIAAEVDNDFLLFDTGGIEMAIAQTPAAIAEAAASQVDFALASSDLILMVVDGREGLTALDEIVAARLRRFGKIVRVVVNKLDNPGEEMRGTEFARLGLGDPMPVSAEHGRGIGRVLDEVEAVLGPRPPAAEGAEKAPARIPFALIGRPNVGKSSLANRLLNSPRLIVSDVPGTTRDAVELNLDYARPDGTTIGFRLIDTAGLRVRGKVDSSVEFFSSKRTEDAIALSEVVFLVVDAIEGVTRQDQSLAGEVLDKGKAIIVVVNKWDLVKERFEREPPSGYQNLGEFQKAYEESLRKELFFLPDPPVLFVSAQSGWKIESMLETALSLRTTLDLKLPTGGLNRCIEAAMEARPPRVIEMRRFKIFYAVQTGTRPFRIRLFCNRVARLDPTYRRYLEHAIQETFRLAGCPVRFELIGKEKRYASPDESTPPAPKWSKAETFRRKKEAAKRADTPPGAAAKPTKPKTTKKSAKKAKPILSQNQRAKKREGRR